jgi:ABC-type amino acid transport substrate-binding protein/cytochrome c5
MKRVALHLGLATALACAAAASPAAQPLRLCADPANLPFSSNAPDSATQKSPGLYVEIGQAVADALGRPMEAVWSLSYFGKRNLRATLLAGQCDLAVGLPAVPDFMGPAVIFSRPILNLGYALVVPKGHAVSGLDSLKGQKVAVQFSSPPQSLLATRDDITLVTVMDPDEGMRRLADGAVDAAFVWGPSASYVNHVRMRDRFDVVAVRGPQLQYEAAIGFARKDAALRDAVDALLPRLESRIRELLAKYAPSNGETLQLAGAAPLRVTARRPGAAIVRVPADDGWVQIAATGSDTATIQLAANDATAASAPGDSAKGDVAAGKEAFNGTCAHCHGPNAVVADRKIDLRRLKHKYGDDMEPVFLKTVTEGRPTKGMPAWKDVFKHQDFVNVLAYLNTVQEK